MLDHVVIGRNRYVSLRERGTGVRGSLTAAMNVEITVVLPQTGYYCVRTSTTQEQVTKDKRCSCGGTAEQPCTHIRAVMMYSKRRRTGTASGASPTLGPIPDSCPHLCGARHPASRPLALRPPARALLAVARGR